MPCQAPNASPRQPGASRPFICAEPAYARSSPPAALKVRARMTRHFRRRHAKRLRAHGNGPARALPRLHQRSQHLGECVPLSPSDSPSTPWTAAAQRKRAARRHEMQSQFEDVAGRLDRAPASPSTRRPRKRAHCALGSAALRPIASNTSCSTNRQPSPSRCLSQEFETSMRRRARQVSRLHRRYAGRDSGGRASPLPWMLISASNAFRSRALVPTDSSLAVRVRPCPLSPLAASPPTPR